MFASFLNQKLVVATIARDLALYGPPQRTRSGQLEHSSPLEIQFRGLRPITAKDLTEMVFKTKIVQKNLREKVDAEKSKKMNEIFQLNEIISLPSIGCRCLSLT